MDKRTETGIVIVGTGFSGLGMAIKLKQEGREDFVILEKAEDVGGTWRDNTYPGCACDIPSHMYSFSFAQNPDWSRSFSGQPEIFDYLRGVARRYDLYRHVRFGVRMTGARWDEEAKRWHVATADGTEFVTQFLVNGVGALHIPQIPELPGIERFQGPAFHSAQWDHQVDLKGKRVAVVGTGASAIQFVPEIAGEVRQLNLFQRTPPWIMPKADHAMPRWTRRLFGLVPGVQRAYRDLLYWSLEARAVGFNGQLWALRAAQKLAKLHIDRTIDDPELRRKVTPDYTMGCKRVLMSNTYYPALARDNVNVVTEGITGVTDHGVVDSAGVEHEVDVIIYGTGFHVTDAFDDLDIIGTDGRNLGKLWSAEGIQTHLGITVTGFPNMFFLLGPNTGLGHNSVVFMIESQIGYVAEAIRLAEGAGGAVEPSERAQRKFNDDIQRKLERGVWTRGGCTNWYLDAMGVNRTIWPGFTWRYWLATRKVDQADFEFGAARAPESAGAGR